MAEFIRNGKNSKRDIKIGHFLKHHFFKGCFFLSGFILTMELFKQENYVAGNYIIREKLKRDVINSVGKNINTDNFSRFDIQAELNESSMKIEIPNARNFDTWRYNQQKPSFANNRRERSRP